MRYRVCAIIFAGFFTMFAAFAIRYSYGLILPEMSGSLGVSKTGAGMIYSSYFLAYTLFSPLLGLLADRTDARYLVTGFVALLSAGAYLMSFATTALQASIFFGMAGVGHSACWAPFVTIVMRWVSEKRRAIAVSIVDLGSAVSIAFWSVMIPFIVAPHGWRAVWVWMGVTGFAAAAMNFLMVRSHPPSTGERGPEDAKRTRMPIRAVYATILRDRRFYLIGCSYLLVSFSILIPFTFLTAYATQELMAPYKSAAILLAVIGISGSIGKLVLSHVSDVAGRVRIMILCGVLIAAGGLGLAFTRDFLLLVFFTIFFGVGYGTIWPVYAASARDLFPKDYAGSIVGLWTLFHGLGSVLAPVLAGWTIDASGTYFWAFILTVVSAALSFILLFPVAGRGSRETVAAGR